ncbi:MAG: hypothetical protein ACMVP2_16885 [Imperialibacter sp.]|uniref:hypothetical protein n=1 Tax=Imperialibacter sp. TaxID=2038411 RepID=UPI003A84ED0C
MEKNHKFSKIPPSSSPANIYKRYLEDIANIDLHSSKIDENKTGLKKGAGINFDNGTISDMELARILKIIDSASINDFRPLVYIIPYSGIRHKVKLVDVDLAANPMSIEFQIPELKSAEFDVIQFK